MVRRLVLVALLVGGVATSCKPAPLPSPVEPYPERQAWARGVDWPAARAEAVAVLAGYLRVDTSNPPGGELAGATYLADVLAREGIEAEITEFAPGRANLVARVRAERPTEPPLCLLSHVDVATAEPERWTHPPFSGHVDEHGFLWGRGALDMKGIGVVELLATAWLKRLDVPLRRDVVLLAVGDEEVDNLGVKALAARWGEIGCSHVLNEGGLGVKGALFDDLTTFGVSYTEKGALWLRMVAQGEAGHGSTPMPDSAPARLTAALRALSARKADATIAPELHTLLGAVGARVGGLEGAVLRSPALTRALALPRLRKHPLANAIVTNTVNVTGFGGAEAPNVIPSRVWAQLDVRMLPGVRGDDMLAELRALVADVPGISFEVISELPAEVSPVDDPLFEAVTRRLQAEFPEAAVGPLIMMGTTDSQVLRAMGVRCYGFAPFVVPQDDLRGMHGHDERIHRDVLGRGLEVMVGIVLDAAAEGGP